MRKFSLCPDAAAKISGGEQAPCLKGSVKFYQLPGSVLVEAELTGLPRDPPSGFFAFHIHGKGDCSGEGFPNTGGHYDTEGRPHPFHDGDLPPLLSCNGRAYLAVITGRFCVKDVIGRSAVIHAGSDDLHSQPAGNAGTKIGCGVICKT